MSVRIVVCREPMRNAGVDLSVVDSEKRLDAVQRNAVIRRVGRPDQRNGERWISCNESIRNGAADGEDSAPCVPPRASDVSQDILLTGFAIRSERLVFLASLDYDRL